MAGRKSLEPAAAEHLPLNFVVACENLLAHKHAGERNSCSSARQPSTSSHVCPCKAMTDDMTLLLSLLKMRQRLPRKAGHGARPIAWSRSLARARFPTTPTTTLNRGPMRFIEGLRRRGAVGTRRLKLVAAAPQQGTCETLQTWATPRRSVPANPSISSIAESFWRGLVSSFSLCASTILAGWRQQTGKQPNNRRRCQTLHIL